MVEHDGAAQVADITAGYVFEGPSLHLGAALVGGTVHAGAQVRLPLAMMNRHGLIAGATGTGKTVTLQVLAEQLSAQGVPVFLSDIKGDLTGLATPGTASDRLAKRTASVGQDWTPAGFPVEFLTLGTGNGVPVRATISSFGPCSSAASSTSTRRRNRACSSSSTTRTGTAWSCTTWPTCAP
jgi:hypothetical protein